MFRIRATNEYGISDPSLSATVFSKQTGAPTCAAGPLAFRVPDFVFGAFSEQKRRDFLRFELLFARFVTNGGVVWLGGVVVRALDLRLERVQYQPLHCRVRPWTSCSHTLSSASEVTTL